MTGSVQQRSATIRCGSKTSRPLAVLRAALVLTAFLVACMVSGCRSMPPEGSSPVSDTLVGQMPALFPQDHPKKVLNQEDQAYAEAALTQWLEAYLHREYKVVDQRFFWAPRGYTTWAAISKGTSLRLSTVFGDRTWIDVPWQEMGLDLAEVWKVQYAGEARYFAVAMTDNPVPGTGGRRLAAYYELQQQSPWWRTQP